MAISLKSKAVWLMAVIVFGSSAVAAAGAEFRCLPTCSPVDGKFLVIASGAGLDTLSDETLDIEIIAPARTNSVQIGLFDGDSGGLDALLQEHWDLGTGIPYSYTLYADPLGDGSGAVPINLVPGLLSVNSSSLPDNGWLDFTIATSQEALSPGGHYFYRLHVELLNSQVPSFNSFKLRTTGIAAIRPESQPFSYMASLGSMEDVQIIYPGYPALSPTTYDGMFRFFFSLLEPQADISVWDGDFDRGKFDGTEADTDDPDTPNEPFLPAWAEIDTVPERVSRGLWASTGNPPDDGEPAYAIFLRSPTVRSELRFPDGQVFANENPSGNQEWEQFRVSTEPFDPALMDFSTASIPAGIYELRTLGVDMGNLNALRLPGPVLCVDSSLDPCSPLYPFTAGDMVFRDLDANGLQFGPGETGISSVVVELLGTSGSVLATTTTDAEGRYSFNLPAGSCTVRIAASNFAPGGPLDGWISTTGGSRTETVVDGNVLTYDFGYRGTLSIGDRVWNDRDGDRVQDAGEHGVSGVTVQLYDADDSLVATATTNSGGSYAFSNLPKGTYSVRLVPSTLPPGLSPVYDLDGLATPHATTLDTTVSRSDADFGYRRRA